MIPTHSLSNGEKKRHRATSTPQTIGVLIPTYKRSDFLLRCLDALKIQQRPADDVMLVVRTEDQETSTALEHYDRGTLPLRMVVTDVPGTVYAHNIGIESCMTDVLCMIDDDTEPQPEWLRVILDNFQADPELGGLGGRDRCFDGTSFDDRQRDIVGKLQWFGRVIGNHHLGFGSIREVDLLKGANMSFRREAVEFARCDVRLRGRGAQPSEDVSLALAVKRHGWKIAYDPAALVYHFQGTREEVRHYSGMTRITNPTAFEDFAYNEVVSIWDSLRLVQRPVFLLWSLLVGTRVCPGLVQAVRFTPSLGRESWYRFKIALRGKSKAIRDLLLGFSKSSQKPSLQTTNTQQSV